MVAALTKTLKFDHDVVAVLRDKVRWSEDGLSAVMPPLDRKMYERISKAFELMGGKWNRKAKATLFPSDPRTLVEGLIQNGELVVEKDGFFRTPGPVIRAMLEIVPIGDRGKVTILEPSAGDGAIVDTLLKSGVMPDRIWCIEKNANRCAVLREKAARVGCGDFMRFKNSAAFRWSRIYMNPPFEAGQDIQHVMKAYTLLSPGGKLVSVMSEGPFFRGDNRSQMFRDWLEKTGGWSDRLPADSFRESGTGVSTRLVMINRAN